LTKTKRMQVYNKYGGRCAYCGKAIEFKDMQVDHIMPQHMCIGIHTAKLSDINNHNPSCRRCNHYKRGESLIHFRQKLKTLHERIQKIYISKVAEDYGIIKVEPWDGTFYFEKAIGGKEDADIWNNE
jgi:5-methylcytosine-specific restriction endonuclease McrA